MSNLPTPQQGHMTGGLPALGPVPAAFRPLLDKASDLGAGVGASFAILTFRGKVWRTKYRGEEYPHLLPAPAPGQPSPGPMPSVDVVMVKASPVISKIFYAEGYSEGDKEAPDCWSVNGEAPDAAAPAKQCTTCAACPQNVWGSKMMPSGKPGKACQDSKRIAVVPADDMHNTTFGGPMLLRIPAASLQDMSAYSSMLQQHGYPYFGMRTRLSFDFNVAYPKITFTPIRAVTEAEAEIVMRHMESPEVKRMLSEGVDQVRHEAPNPALAAPGAQATAPGVQAPAPAVYVPPVAQPVPPQVNPLPMQAAPAGQKTQEQLEAEEMAELERQLAAATAPPPPPVVLALTPAQQRIADLKAQLAAAQAGTTAVGTAQPGTAAVADTAAPAATPTTRRRRGAATPPPSPAPTEAPAPAATLTPAGPVAGGLASTPTMVMADPTMPTGTAVEKDLDDKLSALLDG